MLVKESSRVSATAHALILSTTMYPDGNLGYAATWDSAWRCISTIEFAGERDFVSRSRAASYSIAYPHLDRACGAPPDRPAATW